MKRFFIIMLLNVKQMYTCVSLISTVRPGKKTRLKAEAHNVTHQETAKPAVMI